MKVTNKDEAVVNTEKAVKSSTQSTESSASKNSSKAMDATKKNYKKAYELFYESAQQNSDFAQWLIGTMYEDGHGVSQDYKLAKEWYEKASSNGSSSAFPAKT